MPLVQCSDGLDFSVLLITLHKSFKRASPRLGQGGVDATSRKTPRSLLVLERTGRFDQLPLNRWVSLTSPVAPNSLR
jgi:hypothetical protein